MRLINIHTDNLKVRLDVDLESLKKAALLGTALTATALHLLKRRVK